MSHPKRTSRSWRWLVVVALVAVPLVSLQARFIRPDLVKIPVPRLIQNLEQMVKAKPKDVNLRFNLARAHAMAFAQKTNSVQMRRNKTASGVWFGYTPKAVPFTAKKATKPAEEKAAKKHLEMALARYQEVIKRKKEHLPAKLGHAWLIEQSGKKQQAVKEYRQIIKEAWAKESMLRFGRIGGNFITVETAGYLMPLLDKNTDAAEIQTLKDRIAKLRKLPRPITPIAVPLRNGLAVNDFLDRSAKVKFDADGTGLTQSWTWIRPGAGWLVYDQQDKGKITSALQMFGNVTFWMSWHNGYDAMRTLDDDGDGYLNGSELRHLAIWQDRNGNGVSERGEVKSLAAWGIVKLSCRCIEQTSPDCAAASTAGVYFRDGSVRPTFDVILRQR